MIRRRKNFFRRRLLFCPFVVDYRETKDKEGMTMIRNATREDLPALLDIYAAARDYMRRTGNPTQWGDKYPAPDQLEADMARGELYVICGEDGAPHAAFALVAGEEPGYARIEGKWLRDRPYATIHRMGSDGTLHGCVDQCVAFCRRLAPDLRADTHENNKTVRHLLEKNGFVRCGIVNLDLREGDTRRVAYQYAG